MCEQKPVMQWRKVYDNGWTEWKDFHPDVLNVLYSEVVQVRLKPERKPEYWRSKTSGHIYKDEDGVTYGDKFEPVEVEVKPWHA